MAAGRDLGRQNLPPGRKDRAEAGFEETECPSKSLIQNSII
jgi:hypothetical protein